MKTLVVQNMLLSYYVLQLCYVVDFGERNGDGLGCMTVKVLDYCWASVNCWILMVREGARTVVEPSWWPNAVSFSFQVHEFWIYGSCIIYVSSGSLLLLVLLIAPGSLVQFMFYIFFLVVTISSDEVSVISKDRVSNSWPRKAFISFY